MVLLNDKDAREGLPKVALVFVHCKSGYSQSAPVGSALIVR